VNKLTFFFLLFLSTFSGFSQHYSIENIAGNGSNSFSETTLPALENGFELPGAMAFDNEGNLYFTVAKAFSTDPGEGIYKIDKETNELELFHNPGKGLTGLAIDSENNIYYSRSVSLGEHYIWKIELNDAGEIVEIDSIAGNGTVGAAPISGMALGNPVGSVAGIRLDPTEQYLYYMDWSFLANTMNRINLSSNETERIAGLAGNVESSDIIDGTPALSDSLLFGLGIAFSDDNLYFTTRDFKILRIDNDNRLWHVAGTGVPGYSKDDNVAATAALRTFHGLFLRGTDRLIFADPQNYLIREINLSDGSISNIAGTNMDNDDNPDGELINGTIAEASLSNIAPVDFYQDGDTIYFTDNLTPRVRRMFICQNPVINEIVANKNDICQGEQVTLTIDGSLNDAEYWVWYENGCFQDSIGTTETITVQVNETSTYSVIGVGECTNIDACQDITINVDPSCASYYNTFTPNGDGKNEFLEIPILINFPINTVTIYSRWGHELSVIENYDNTSNVWSGELEIAQNNLVDAGTYYFTAESNGNVVTSGWIQVIR